jgi:hypothetical protein
MRREAASGKISPAALLRLCVLLAHRNLLKSGSYSLTGGGSYLN